VKEQNKIAKAIQKARKAIDDAIKKAKKDLNRRGIDAQQAKREQKKTIADLEAKREHILIKLYKVIRDPEKDPTPDDLESLKPHLSLV
jgi:hypothetical protein